MACETSETSETLMFVTRSKTFEITDYSMIVKAISGENFIWSDRFTVAGYEWVIRFYPQGSNESFDHVSVFVELLNTTKEVQAMYSFHLQDWNTSKWSTTIPANTPLVLSTFSGNGRNNWGYNTFIKRSVLEDSNYLKDDTLVIKCTLWVASQRHQL